MSAHTPETVNRYIRLRQTGNNKKRAAQLAGVSRRWAQEFERDRLAPEIRASFPDPANRQRIEAASMPREDLGDLSAAALEDFELFRARFFGRRSAPWQVEAGQLCAGLLATDDKEFVVINCPPGAGKSTLIHDICAWLICRDRSVRLLMGSRTERQAVGYAARIKRTLERRTPMTAKDDERRMGLATDAAAALCVEYGPFKPTTQGEIWRREQFTVVQAGETPTDEKESTVTAFGMDSGQLGWRVNGIFWDDLVDRSTVRTDEAVERQRQWYEDEAETRLEPGGLLVLCGQRIAANDLYRHCLDMPAASVTELDAEGDLDTTAGARKYHHIVYKAHDDTRCEGVHQPGVAEPQPAGCLLDPVRIPWRELRHLMGSREQKFRVLYQQEDVDPASVLVPKLWVDGGRDPSTGEEFVGCWDSERRIGELPRGLRAPLVSVATADPSPTKFWGIEWWVYQPSTGLRFLMDLERRAMDAPDFLDWNEQTRSFHGVMHEWQRRSVGLGVPIQAWVVEQNAAQRFILQYDHFRRWSRDHNVRVFGHETSRNKADAELGVEASLKPVWRRGLVRLPGSQDGITRTAALKLVDEVTRYPDVTTTDLVMAQWFFEFNRHHFEVTPADRMPRAPRPHFVREDAAA